MENMKNKINEKTVSFTDFLNKRKIERQNKVVNGTTILDKDDIEDIARIKKEIRKMELTHDSNIKKIQLENDLKNESINEKLKNIDNFIELQKKENEITKVELEKAKNDVRKSVVKQATDFFNVKNENNVNLINDDKKQSSIFFRNSKKCTIVSAVTSIVGMLIDLMPTFITGTMTERIISVLVASASIFLYIFIARMSSSLLNMLPNYINNYAEKKDKKSIVIILLSLVGVGSNIILSIITNFLFWSATKLIIFVKYFLAFILDIFSIIFTLIGTELKNLNYNEKKTKIYNDIINTKDEPKKRVVKKDNTNVKNTNNVGRKTNTKEYNILYDYISNNIEKGDRITPKKCNFVGNKTMFYEYINCMDFVEKKDKFYYKK